MAALPPVHRAAVLYDCQLCGHRTARPFSTLQAAADALRRAGGQVSEVLLTRAAAAAASGGKQQQQHPQQCSGIKGVDKAANKTGLLGTAVTEPAEEQGPVTLVEKQAEQQQAEQQAEQQQAEQQQAEQQQAEQQQAEQQQQQMEKQQQAAKTQPQLRGQQQRREVEQQQQQQQQEEQKEQVMVEEEMGADGAAMEAVSRTADEPAAEPGEEAAEVEEAADPAKAERQEHEEASMPPATPGTQPSVQQQQRRQECKEEPQPFLFGFNVQQTVTAPSAMEEASDKAAAVAQVPAQLDDDGDVEVPRRSRKRVHHSLSPTGAAVVAGDAALHAAALPTGHRAAKRARRISWADAKDAELERVRVFEQEPSDEVEKAAALVSTVAAAVAAGKRLRFKLWQRVGRRWCVFKPSG